MSGPKSRTAESRRECASLVKRVSSRHRSRRRRRDGDSSESDAARDRLFPVPVPVPVPVPRRRRLSRGDLAVDGVEARVAAETLAQRVGTHRRASSRAVFFVVVVERARSFFLRRLSRRFLGRADLEPRRGPSDRQICVDRCRVGLKGGGGVRGSTVREPGRARREGLAAGGENRPPRGDARGRARRRAIAVLARAGGGRRRGRGRRGGTARARARRRRPRPRARSSGAVPRRRRGRGPRGPRGGPARPEPPARRSGEPRRRHRWSSRGHRDPRTCPRLLRAAASARTRRAPLCFRARGSSRRKTRGGCEIRTYLLKNLMT
jgi:hypothetical protein